MARCDKDGEGRGCRNLIRPGCLIMEPRVCGISVRTVSCACGPVLQSYRNHACRCRCRCRCWCLLACLLVQRDLALTRPASQHYQTNLTLCSFPQLRLFPSLLFFLLHSHNWFLSPASRPSNSTHTTNAAITSIIDTLNCLLRISCDPNSPLNRFAFSLSRITSSRWPTPAQLPLTAQVSRRHSCDNCTATSRGRGTCLLQWLN